MSKQSMNGDTKVRTQMDVEQLERPYTMGGNLNPLQKTVSDKGKYTSTL